MADGAIPKMFLYCRITTKASTVKIFRNKGFFNRTLDGDPRTFWTSLEMIQDGGTLVLLSHGDGGGPLLVEGRDGNSITEEETVDLARTLQRKRIKLYLLSCHTGGGRFFRILSEYDHIQVVAPLGYCSTRQGEDSVSVFSVNVEGMEEVDGGNVVHATGRIEYLGWASLGGLLPARHRNTRPLQIE